MAERALVTGIGGFVAGHLAALLLDRGVSVFGTFRPGREPESLPPSVHLLPASLEDRPARFVFVVKPDETVELRNVTAGHLFWLPLHRLFRRLRRRDRSTAEPRLDVSTR